VTLAPYCARNSSQMANIGHQFAGRIFTCAALVGAPADHLRRAFRRSPIRTILLAHQYGMASNRGLEKRMSLLLGAAL
jgi:hypothetical protein